MGGAGGPVPSRHDAHLAGLRTRGVRRRHGPRQPRQCGAGRLSWRRGLGRLADVFSFQVLFLLSLSLSLSLSSFSLSLSLLSSLLFSSLLLSSLCSFAHRVPQVREVVAAVRPASVVVELCPERARRLREGGGGEGGGLEAALGMLRSVAGGRGGGAFEALLKIVYRMFEKLGSKPGGEFAAALDECDTRGIPCIYGDQEASVTLAKLKAQISLPKLLAIMARAPDLSAEQREVLLNMNSSSPEELVERLKTRAFVESSVKAMRSVSPDLAAILLDERDVILCEAIRKAPGPRIVAVVGMAHMDGIERNWNKHC